MLTFNTFLSNHSIRKQILIGFLPILVALIIIMVLLNKSVTNSINNLEELSEINQETRLFLEVEKDIVTLQRNTLVYAYVGYSGVLRKVEYLETVIEEKLNNLNIITNSNEQVKDRLERLRGHYKSYKEAFAVAVEKRKEISRIKTEFVYPLGENMQDSIKSLADIFKQNKTYKNAYIASYIANEIAGISANFSKFELSPDASLIKEIDQAIKTIKQQVTTLSNNASIEITTKINAFSKLLSTYQDNFKEVIRLNRIYLHLNNVVLAGKAAEIDVLAEELHVIIKDLSAELTKATFADIKASKNNFIALAAIAMIISVLCALTIAASISRPVRQIANTLSGLSSGEKDTEIPGLLRKDEVGEMAKSADTFKNMANELEEQTIELEEFSYRTSHDLRSPLISSIGMLRVVAKLIEKDKKDDALKNLTIASNSLKKLDHLVEDILTLTTTQKIEEEDQAINVKQSTVEAIGKFTHLYHFDRLSIEQNIPPKLSITTKKTRFTLILENLISNAIKYQDESKNDSYVKITAVKKNNQLMLSVEDNGLGIPEEKEDQLFKMFKRFHAKTSFGSGLGLYMVHKSAEVLNGTMNYENTGNGTKFTLIIPIEPMK